MTLKKLIRELNANPAVTISITEYEDCLWVFNFAIAEHCQSCGIGSSVIRTVQAYAQSVNKPVCLMPLSIDNRHEDLCRFYQRLGFDWIGEWSDMEWLPKVGVVA